MVPGWVDDTATPVEDDRATLREAEKNGADDVDTAPPADVDSWAIYLREVGQVRRLTPAEELELGRRIAQGDRRALQRLVEANLRLVIAVARRYRHEGLPLYDLVQEGNIGLLRAAQKFDYRKGFRFSTYAIWWIRQAVSRAVANQAYAIRVPTHIQEGLGRAERAPARAGAGEDGARNEREGGAGVPSGENGAAREAVSAETLDLVRRARQTISLERTTGEEDDAVLSEVVADTEAPSPFEVTSNHLLRERLLALLRDLPARERAIVGLRYGLVDGRPRTCAEVGAHLDLTRERVRQIEVLALGKLRQGPGGRELATFLS